MTRRTQWRSLDQLADTPRFRQFLQAEFPAVTDLSVGPERRQFLKLMAASLALAGLSGCDDPPDGRSEEVPYVKNPLRALPGTTLHYASVTMVDGFANGVLVTTIDGRPYKIEGNPQHPWSRGGTDIFGQAAILDLWDPARSETVRHLGEASNWQTVRGMTLGRFAALKAGGGDGFRLLTGPVTSPSLRAQTTAMLQAYPGMHWHTHAPVDRAPLYASTQRVFGRALETRWRFDRARVLVALDGDFLDPGPHQVGVAKDWAAARQASAKAGALLAMHAAGPLPNLTSAKADYTVPATPEQLADLAQNLLADIASPQPAPPDASPLQQWRARVAAALAANRGAGLVIAGATAPQAVQDAVHRLNAALGNTGQTVFYTAPIAEPAEPLSELVSAMASGQVSALVMLDTNPAYDAPASLGFNDALEHVALKIHAGLFEDETALRCDWHLPLAHPLESWGDARSLDGTVGLLQPMIDPLYEGRSAAEILSFLMDSEPQTARDMLQAFWRGSREPAAFEPEWQAMLRDGFIAGSALQAEAVQPGAAPPSEAAAPPDGLSVLFRPDPTIWDGRAANNAWLQELPKPLTKLVWENALFVSPALAAREHLEDGDIATLGIAGQTIEGPVWILPGQADNTVGVTLGYGRTVPDMLSTGAGYDAYVLRSATDPWQETGATISKTGRRTEFATTQDHNTMEGQSFVRVQHEGAAPVGETTSWTQPTLYQNPRPEDKDVAWGMVIDLDACTGCNACVVACQSENNIAVVGKEQVALGREMHWLRIDRYYDGPPEAPKTHFQPVPCMHCEDAPCEVGCPVEATLHDSQGLNLMVYNRCVGTRACSGYCPYKVRHFNYLDYSAGASPQLELERNPSVSVRSRGVMEKCTYCVQRIERARIDASKSNGQIADGQVQTACQGACPANAITFGNLRDAASAVSAARSDTRNYALLGELNTRPRTTYLAARAPRLEGEG